MLWAVLGMMRSLLRTRRELALGNLAPRQQVAVLIRTRGGRRLFSCPFLVEEKDGVFTCSVYDHRPPSCRLFPMVPADLREVDCCGFRFEKSR